jgi:hypothetical protein
MSEEVKSASNDDGKVAPGVVNPLPDSIGGGARSAIAIAAWVRVYLQGKKTYGAVGVSIVFLAGQWRGWWVMPNELYMAMLGVVLAFMKAGQERRASNGDSVSDQ